MKELNLIKKQRRLVKAIGRDGFYIAVREYSDRKKPCLVIEKGNQALIVASFINHFAAEDFRGALTYILDGDEIEEESHGDS